MDSIKKAKEVLTELAKTTEEKSSVRSPIKALKNEIRAARKSGKTWREIAIALESAGVKTTTQALSSLCSIKKKRTTNEDKGEKKAQKIIQVQQQTKTIERHVLKENAARKGEFALKEDVDIFTKATK